MSLIQKLLPAEYSFIDKQSGEGFQSDYLGHEEFFKGDDLAGSKGDCHSTHLLDLFQKFINRLNDGFKVIRIPH